jgi:hypothetical protein
MIWWCSTCGMEDLRSHNACPSCGSALQTADLEWLAVGETDAETVFELELEPMERGAIVATLVENNIRHRWDDVHELVVRDQDVDAVDALLDEILGEEDELDDSQMLDLDGNGEIDALEDDDLDGNGEDDGYDAISDLFIAVDKLLKSRNDERVADFRDAAEHVLEITSPFGVDDETWADVQSAARNASVALEQDSKAPIDSDLKGLYNQLQLLV